MLNLLPDLRESFRYQEEEEPHIINQADVEELQMLLASVDAMERLKPTVKVLFLSIYYPFFLGKYFERALRRNPRIDLITAGPFTGTFIPWMGGMNLPQKYANPPDIPLPFNTDVGRVSYDLVRARLPVDWRPDLVIACDAGLNWIDKPNEGYVVTIGTDPHVLNDQDYPHSRQISDKFFNMQKCYSERDDVYLPYAYDPTVHYVMGESHTEKWLDGREARITSSVIKDTDCVLIGMPYHKRIQWVEELGKHGVSVIFENSPVFDEYRELANRAVIGLNWSSLNDLNARFFETPAFGLAMVTNRVPDAHLFLTEGLDYLGFDTLEEAVQKVLHLKNNPDEAERISQSAYQKIQPHTYDARVEQILEEIGL